MKTSITQFTEYVEFHELPDAIERDVRRAGAELAADDALVAEVMRAVRADRAARAAAQAAADVRAAARRRMIVRGSMALAACVLLGLGLWMLLSTSGENTLYAQVAAAMIEAKSLHAVANRWHNGQWEKSAEVMYERDKGVYEWTRRGGNGDGKVLIRIDDGAHEWRFSPDEPVARKSASRDPKGVVREIVEENRRIDRSQRDPAGDESVDGTPCHAYVSIADSGKVKYRVLVDRQHRIRRFEESAQRDDGRWEPLELSTIRYDLAIDPKTFVPALPAGVRLIEPDATTMDAFRPDAALYTQEEMGMRFAVHRVARLADGSFLVVRSLRPTDDTRREIPPSRSGPAAQEYASLMQASSFKRLDGERWRSYASITLAEAYHDGLSIDWTIYRPAGDWSAEEAEQFEVSFRVNADGALAERLRAAGKPAWGEFRHVATLKATPSKSDAVTVTADVYREAEVLETAMARVRLQLKSVPFTDADMEAFYREHPAEPRLPGRRMLHGRSEPPSHVSEEQFLREVSERLAEAG